MQTLVWQIILRNRSGNYAEVAHLVEHDLAKVGVAGSSPVFRSEVLLPCRRRIFFDAPVVELVDTSRLDRDDPQWSLHRIELVLVFHYIIAPVVELVDTQDLKSCDPQRS